MVDYDEIKNQLRQKQMELASQRVNIPKRMLRTGIQGLPQRKQIGLFNKQLREQSKRYGKQISDIDRFLLAKEEQSKRISSMGRGEDIPINPEPNITFFPNPNLKRLRNRFKKGGSWF